MMNIAPGHMPGMKKRTKEKAGLTGWNHVLNVVKKCSTDLEKLYSIRDSSAKISSLRG